MCGTASYLTLHNDKHLTTHTHMEVPGCVLHSAVCLCGKKLLALKVPPTFSLAAETEAEYSNKWDPYCTCEMKSRHLPMDAPRNLAKNTSVSPSLETSPCAAKEMELDLCSPEHPPELT